MTSTNLELLSPVLKISTVVLMVCFFYKKSVKKIKKNSKIDKAGW